MTSRCENCHATVPADATTCPYCQAVTRYGAHLQQASAASQVYHQQARAQLDVQQQYHQQQQRKRAFENTATYALIASIIGLLTCLLPIASIIAIILALHSRSLAKKEGLAKPPRATIGLILGLLGAVTGSAGLIWMITDISADSETRKAHIAKLEARVAKSAKRAKLNRKTACDLVKLEILRTGEPLIYDEKKIECRGRLAVDKSRAVLHGVRAMTADPVTVVGCIERIEGEWILQSVREDDSCWGDSEKDAAASSAASATTSP